MSASGKKKGKKKWTPVALDAVLPNAVVRTTTSWAEEVESELQLSDYAIKKISNLNLPTAPRAACDLVIDESKIPRDGPFVAYLSNLPYEITEDDIAQNFKELKVASIKLPRDDRQDRMKGFGYVEFKDKSNLIAALQQGELTLKGRNVLVSLPDDDSKSDRGSRSGGMSFNRNRDSDRNDRSDKPLGEWRAGAPVPHDPEKSTAPKHSGVGFTRQQNRDRDGGNAPFREFRSGFQPADSGPSFSRGGGGFRERDDRDGGRSSERGGGNRPFKRFEPRDDRVQRSAFGKKFDRDDREREFKREPVEREEPKQRPRIEVLPRSVPTDETARAPQALPASIFGAAKPVDTTKREMEMEAKLHMMSTSTASTRGGSSPRLTPTSNLSRASSVSSISSSRRREGDTNETATDSSKWSAQSENLDKSEPNDGGADVARPAENVWAQRSAAKAVASAPADDDAENASSTVIEECAEAVEEDASSSVYVPPQPGSRTNQHDEGGSSNAAAADDGTARYTAPRPETDKNDQRNWTTYGQDTFSGSQQSMHGDGSGRYGGRGGRYSDNKFGSNFNRDNRRERRDNHRDGGEYRNDRYSQKRGGRDDNFGGSNSFPSKWNHNNREGGGSFRNRNNDYGGPRRHDRDNGGGGGGGGGSFGSFRDRNENKSNAYRSFGSANHHSRSHDSGGEYRGGRGRHEERHLRYNERLNDSEENARDSFAATRNADEQQHAQPPETADSRLRDSPERGGGSKPLENGGTQENGVVEGDEGVRESSENLAVDGAENENAFKTRKKHKKKKSNADLEEITAVPVAANKRDARSTDATDRKPRNQKEERKNPPDNHLTNEKTPTKNNLKTKDNRNERSAKKSREPRDDASQMPKQKEEKAPNFQDTNRFQFLNSED